MTKKKSILSHLNSILLLGTLGILLGASCTNSGSNNASDGSEEDLLTSDPTTEGGDANGSFKIANVTIQTGTQGGSSGIVTSIFFEGDQTGKITSICNGKVKCQCEYKWKELNQTSENTVTIDRTLRTDTTSIQPTFVSCDTPATYSTEIDNGTIVQIKVVSSDNSLKMNPFSYTKGISDAGSSDFLDSEGRGFVNIHRYTCYEKVRRGVELTSQVCTVNSDAGESIKVTFATQFCVDTTQGSGGGSAGNNDCCQGVGGKENSAQSNYYSLYLPSTNLGAANLENSRYTCPRVKEPISGKTGLGFQDQIYPKDTTFALAKSISPEFPLGVIGPSVLESANDPTSGTNNLCGSGVSFEGEENPASEAPPAGGSGGSGSSPQGNQIAGKCLGFAKKPNSDGTCGSFKDANGITRLTYRLRKFVALYPPSFDTDGRVIAQAHAIDVAYVLDRPLKSPNPLKPYTMLGPKPCNFSYFDGKGVLGQSPTSVYNTGRPTYVATNHEANKPVSFDDTVSWDGTNVDNIYFPNTDVHRESCAAIIPMVQYSTSGDPLFVTMGTTHESNVDRTLAANVYDVGGNKSVDLTKVYVRPIEAWAPHYVEDTSFEACAPQSDPMRDPPLHFAKDNQGQIAWCAEVYPSQNNNIEAIDINPNDQSDSPPGYVKPFTSHVVKNSVSAPCAYTPLDLPSDYPANSGTGSCSRLNQLNTYVSNAAVGQDGVARHPDDLAVDDLIGEFGILEGVCSNRTCDRTVSNVGSGAWKRFPLLAEPKDVEQMLMSDPSYRCTVTYDAGNGKSGKTTPADGCCDDNIVRNPFFSSHLKTGGAGSGRDAAHLEPDRVCLPPDF